MCIFNVMLLRTNKNVVCKQRLGGPKTSQPDCCSVLQVHRNGECANWDQLLQHTWHKYTIVLQFDKCTELQDFLLFCAAILRDKELLCPCKSLIQEQNELGDGAAVEAGLQCVGGTAIISFPESLALQCSNSQVSALAYTVGNIFVPPKVQLLTLARQLLFPVSRNPICSIQ